MEEKYIKQCNLAKKAFKMGIALVLMLIAPMIAINFLNGSLIGGVAVLAVMFAITIPLFGVIDRKLEAYFESQYEIACKQLAETKTESKTEVESETEREN